MHSKVTSNILDYRNPKNFRSRPVASLIYTELEILLNEDRMVEQKNFILGAFETNCLGDLLHSLDRISSAHPINSNISAPFRYDRSTPPATSYPPLFLTDFTWTSRTLFEGESTLWSRRVRELVDGVEVFSKAVWASCQNISPSMRNCSPGYIPPHPCSLKDLACLGGSVDRNFFIIEVVDKGQWFPIFLRPRRVSAM